MEEKVILLPLKKQFADRILEGTQTDEKRTSKFKEPVRAIIYVTKVKTVVGEFMMGPGYGDPIRLPKRKRNYYKNEVSKVIQYENEIPWEEIKKKKPGIRGIPQMYTYLNPTKVPADLELLKFLEPYKRKGEKLNW
ncbi:MAG: hypothetical protein ISS18_03125 [Bacteroidales bacterium]|nr:hypothetical protein [Bacteroidales bacterium]